MKKIISSCILCSTLLLAACGGDDNTATEPVPVSVSEVSKTESTIIRDYPNLELVGTPDTPALDRNIAIKIGDNEAFILDMRNVKLPQTRPDVFVEGHHSMFDLFRYLDEQGLLDLQWDGKINKYDSVDFTVNNEEDWYFTVQSSAGKLIDKNSKQFLQYYPVEDVDGDGDIDGDDAGIEISPDINLSLRQGPEVQYSRIDRHILRNDDVIHIRQIPHMTEIMDSILKEEWESSAGQDVVTVKNVYIYKAAHATASVDGAVNFADGPRFHAYLDYTNPDIHLTNIEVKAFNLRPEVYQPGVISYTDVLATIATDPRYYEEFSEDERKIQLTAWNTFNDGEGETGYASVNSYALTQIGGKHEDTGAGWTLVGGSSNHLRDFEFLGGELCPRMHPENPLGSEIFCQQFGGNFTHRPLDYRLIPQGTDDIHLMWYDLWYKRYDLENRPPKPAKKDHYLYNNPAIPMSEEFYVPDIDLATQPLTETHFGWKLPDCGTCHSVEEIHSKNDSGERFDFVAPHKCAACHGSNGAPKGHDMTGRCFRCHHDVPKHADNGINHDHIDAKSKTFPDPFSCVTCHKNPNEVTDPSVTHDVFMKPS